MFEYETKLVEQSDLDPTLNTMAAQGWELQHMLPRSPTGYTLTFRRVKREKADDKTFVEAVAPATDDFARAAEELKTGKKRHK